jgi:hypothetical protein
MRWRRACEADGVHVDDAHVHVDDADAHSGASRSGRARRIRLALVIGSMCACAMGSAESTVAAAGRCPNEEFRTGPSANLPDCRAYELVTPEELGRTQALTFSGADFAAPSLDGEHLALQTFAPLEPGPSAVGTRAVYSRTQSGWTAKSMIVSELLGHSVTPELLSPDLTQVAFRSVAPLNQQEKSTAPRAYDVGPVGGPYATMADIPSDSGTFTYLVAANAGTPSVPPMSDVVFESSDHQLLPSGPEGKVAEETEPGRFSDDAYDWTEGKLHLVNVEGEGAHVKRLNTCGTGVPGAGGEPDEAIGAVSSDGSMIFFESPLPESPCGPSHLYMRLDNRETVEVSAPAPGVNLNPAERRDVRFNAASADGTEVVFNTSTPLLTGETANELKLFVYDTVTHELKLIANSGLPNTEGTEGSKVLISEDGSAVYYEASGAVYRYDTGSATTSFIATVSQSEQANEPSYTTPNGQFFLFASGDGGVRVRGRNGLELEPRGVNHNELYRYDASDGSVMCVSCGDGVAPAEGVMIEPRDFPANFVTSDETPVIAMAEDGQRVFFETTAQLVPQDTNSPKFEGASTGGAPGLDVYEWEAPGTEEAPGVLCHGVNGCTHLISTGEDVGKATFLGASEDGSNVFFATAGQLLPQADAEFTNIYDARIDGGFAPPPPASECLSCQGVGSPTPLVGPGASMTFAGAGNPVAPVKSVPSVKCKKGFTKRRNRCVKTRRKRAKKASRRARR